ncbi:N-acetylglucosamine kinase [Deinococcus sp. ME38]|uniref:N-acetylglucosamine kinase n=1 Tax=Deinococcus sp. ME38 TaxID=3400344 RepID=UPI003B59D213
MTRSPLLLGLDAGGSGTKWTLVRAGQSVASGRTAPFTAALLGTPAGDAALAELGAALPGRPDAAHAGVPGLSAGSDRAAQVAAALAGTLRMDAAHLSLEGDLDLAYRSHLSPGAGVLLYAGTGSVAYHVGRAGEVVRAGGRGYRIGDDGAGFSLGRAALRVLTAAIDRGQEPDSPLAREVRAVTGGTDWDTLRSFTYGDPGASAVARLAPAVSRAAEAGDAEASHLIEEAAQSLAELARRVQEQAGPLPVTATGGALRSPLLAAALGRALPGVNVQQRDHAEAAARYAGAQFGG